MIGVRPIRIRGSSLGFDEISRDHLTEQLSGWSEAVCMDLIHAPTPFRGHLRDPCTNAPGRSINGVFDEILRDLSRATVIEARVRGFI